MLTRNVTCVHRRARRAHLAAQQIRQLAHQLEIFRAAHARAPSDNDRRVLEIDGGLARLAAQNLQHPIALVKRRFDPFDDALSRRVGFPAAHHALAHRRHLGPRVRVDDGRDDVAAERRSNLVKQILVDLFLFLGLVVTDLQIGAIGGQPAADRAGDARRQVAPDRRRAE